MKLSEIPPGTKAVTMHPEDLKTLAVSCERYSESNVVFGRPDGLQIYTSELVPRGHCHPHKELGDFVFTPTFAA